jgi:iron complex transport system substrate-binding protein
MSPARIVSLVSSATEILFGLGLGNQVVAVSHECDWPPDVATRPRLTSSRIDAGAASQEIDAAVRRLMKDGQPLYDLNVDLLAALKPDLIITQAQCDVCAIRYDDVLAAVAANPTLARAQVVALSPKCLGDVLDDVSRIGAAAGTRENATRYCSDLSQRIHNVQRRTSAIAASQRPTVCVVEWFNPLIVSGNWVPEILEMAGGKPGLSRAGQHSPAVTWDLLKDFNPDVLILTPCGFSVQRAKSALPELLALSGFNELAAVRRGRLHILDGNAYFNRPGPRLVDSLEITASLLHPPLFPPPA